MQVMRAMLRNGVHIPVRWKPNRAWAKSIVAILAFGLAIQSCGMSQEPIRISSAGNCRILGSPDSEEYAQYVLTTRRAAGCEQPGNIACKKQIKLELIDYPRHIPRARFEKPDWERGDVAHIRLRTTNLTNYDLWISQYFSPEPWHKWGYDLQLRDSTGKLLQSPVLAFLDSPNCDKYVVLSSGNSMERDIPISGAYLETLKGTQLDVSVIYEVAPLFAPMAVRGTVPVLDKYASNTVSILID
jgi:hypothetical protein